MWNILSDDEYKRRADLLRKNTQARRHVNVRDAMRILGLSSTSATRYTLQRMVELGLLKYEPPRDGGRKGNYYVEEEHDQTEMDAPAGS